MSKKVNKAIKITYQAAGATTGLVDVISKILDETESLDPINFPDITLVESVDIPGEYLGSFTPDTVGTWRSVTDSATKPGKIVRQYDVVANDADSINDAVGNLNDIDAAGVNAEVDTALADYDVAKASDIVSPPMVG
jgi:hypothetical protein